jgi:hypothetical protein
MQFGILARFGGIMRPWLLSLLLLLSTFSLSVKADITSDTHFWAHAGTAYALTTVSYGLFHKTLGLNQTASTVLSVLFTNGVSITREAIVSHNNNVGIDWNDVKNAAIGSGVAAGTVLIFNF